MVQLISSDYLINRSMVDPNVDANLLNTFIQTAQDMWIQGMLSENLQTKITTDVANGVLSGSYKSLVDNFVQPALMWWTIAQGLRSFNWKITNLAVLAKTTDKATVIQSRDLDMLKEEYEQIAQWYSQRIWEFIVNNPADFMEYYTTNGVFQMPPRGTEYDTGGISIDRNVRTNYTNNPDSWWYGNRYSRIR
jgi:hypothetical protein